MIYLHRKDLKQAREAVDQSIEALSNEAPSKYLLNRVKIISGLICYEMKDAERGEREIEEALDYFSSISSYNSLVETHFVLAFLKNLRKKKGEAALHLQKGFQVAANQRYKYFYSLGTTYSILACLLALELKIEGGTDYINQLLGRCLFSVDHEEIKRLSQHPDSAVREQVWKVRRTIFRSKVPSLRIQTLGALQIFRGDSLMHESEWDRIQPKKLLEAIISYGGRGVPKEILMDELWPEDKQVAAEKNFKTTLQRLRKSLEPSIHKDFTFSYVHLHDNLVHLDEELCEVDAERFLLLLRMAEEKEKKAETKSALSLYTEAMDIYKGDFLPDELYAPWADKKREELKRKFIELLNRVARLYERQGAIRKAIDCYNRAIQEDPLMEEAYQKLMTFYSSKGMYNDALKIYQSCKKLLKTELKTKPDSTTNAIYKQILEKVGPPRPAKREIPPKKKTAKK
jgi:DNA-binding SARP family transcriptional activator